MREHAKHTSRCLIVSAFLLQLVATFDEIYGLIHGIVSTLFFVLLIIASMVYFIERRSFLGIIAFIVILGS
jgi:hypothetical membrane protein